jgi:hypothetical protein
MSRTAAAQVPVGVIRPERPSRTLFCPSRSTRKGSELPDIRALDYLPSGATPGWVAAKMDAGVASSNGQATRRPLLSARQGLGPLRLGAQTGAGISCGLGASFGVPSIGNIRGDSLLRSRNVAASPGLAGIKLWSSRLSPVRLSWKAVAG